MNSIEQAKQNFLHAIARMKTAIRTIPDDKVNWSPTPTARSPIAVVAHAAAAIHALHETFDGRTFSIPTPAQADIHFLEYERQFSTREQVLDLLEANADALVAWFDQLQPDRLTAPVTLPFGMGEVPLELAITFPTHHTNDHSAQLDYIQTILGDRVWH